MKEGVKIKRILKLCVVFSIALAFSSCSFSSNNNKSTEKPPQVQAPISSAPNKVNIEPSVTISSIEEIVNTLSSDQFEGRLTGSKGNEKAGEYIEKIFRDIGLEPFHSSSYYQKFSQEVIGTYGGDGSDAKVETVNNVIGVIKGKESKNAVVISAHFDHLGYVNGKIMRGAIDNASGVAALIEIAHVLKEKSKAQAFDMDIVLCAFNGEETGLNGSKAFVKEVKSNSIYNNMFNINIDSIGAKEGGKLALKNESKLSSKLYGAIKATIKKHNIDFSDVAAQGLSDHRSFENGGIPNISIVQENIKKLIHKPTDTPNTLDYVQIQKIADSISDFVETNGTTILQE